MRRTFLLIVVIAIVCLALPGEAIEKCVYHPTFPRVNADSFEAAFGVDNSASLNAVVTQEVNTLLNAGVTMVTTGYPGEGDPSRFWQAIDIARPMGITVFVPLQYSDMISYYAQHLHHIDGFTIADEPIGHDREVDHVAFLTSWAQGTGKQVWVNFDGKEADNVLEYIETSTPYGRIADHLDIISVDHYGLDEPYAQYSKIKAAAIKHGLEFMAVIGDTESCSVQHLDSQRQTALDTGATYLALWTMNGDDDVSRPAVLVDGCTYYNLGVPYMGTMQYELYMTIEDDGYGHWWYEVECYPIGTGPGGEVYETGPYEWHVKSIVASKPNLWNAFAGY